MRWLLVLCLFSFGIATRGESAEPTCQAPTQTCLDLLVLEYKNKAWIGIELDLERLPKEHVLLQVFPDSPADRAGLKPGDHLLAVDKFEIVGASDQSALAHLFSLKAGDKASLRLRRGSAQLLVELTSEVMPLPMVRQIVGAHMVVHQGQTIEKGEGP